MGETRDRSINYQEGVAVLRTKPSELEEWRRSKSR